MISETTREGSPRSLQGKEAATSRGVGHGRARGEALLNAGRRGTGHEAGAVEPGEAVCAVRGASTPQPMTWGPQRGGHPGWDRGCVRGAARTLGMTKEPGRMAWAYDSEWVVSNSGCPGVAWSFRGPSTTSQTGSPSGETDGLAAGLLGDPDGRRGGPDQDGGRGPGRKEEGHVRPSGMRSPRLFCTESPTRNPAMAATGTAP